jgi:hypothetical protein
MKRKGDEGPCETCFRLKLECLGFDAKRPDWLRVCSVSYSYSSVSDLYNFFHRRPPASPPSEARSKAISQHRGCSRVTLALALVVPPKRIIYACQNTERATSLIQAGPPVPIGSFQRSLIAVTLCRIMRHLPINLNISIFTRPISCTLTMVGLRTIIKTLSFLTDMV